ncbi:TetR/AcrR family transcriptional regulator [Halorubellus sp. PRR65]|uniref:TetR/AcrR family transcriptional regulator n=1 Tax=Halorubellus sp. PRR65 TaxID=3098148 RepID=UPI002B258971|nr:TetR/AcrR family transcriptional regulator [Halorubellus sp. PRR65]
MDSDTTDEIMTATGRALYEHGYANLTIQRIAEESSLSTAAIHYHFDTKEALLNAYLDHLVGAFRARIDVDTDDPRDRLSAFLDAVFDPAGDDVGFAVALMNLKAQAPFSDAYHERFVELDDAIRTEVTEVVRDGVESGCFDDADPGRVARHVVTVLNGAHVRELALGESPAESRAPLEAYLDGELDWRPEAPA